MHTSAIGASELREGNITRISYLASVRARWLPAWSPHEIKYVTYCTHRVSRQFGFDQDISGSNLEVLGSNHCMDPYLYPGPSRVGACTKRMHDYWTRVMRVFVKYVRGGTPSDIPMLGLYVEPPSKFRILRNVASRKGYSSHQGRVMLSGMNKSRVGRFMGLNFLRSGLLPMVLKTGPGRELERGVVPVSLVRPG